MNTIRQSGIGGRKEKSRRSMAVEIGMTALFFPFYWPSRSGGRNKSQRKLKDNE
jgi:hypothetical protein